MQTKDKRIRKATVVGKDKRCDIAVLKIENTENEVFPSLSFGDSRNVKAGDSGFVIGNPFYSVLESTVTSGVISATNRNGLGWRKIEGYIQTDAPINGGNSGGPLLNSKGEVIGVASYSFSSWYYAEGIGFAVPSHVVERIANQIIDNKKVTEGYFGARVDFSKTSAFDGYYFDPYEGAILKKVISDSPADKAGLQVGDTIIAIDGISIDSAYSFDNEIQCYPAHSKITLTVDRDGEILKIPVTLGDDVLH